MDTNKSGVNATFGFGKANVDNDKQMSDKDTTSGVVDNKTVQDLIDEKNDREYIDKRTITIALVRNYSKYREANRSALPKRVDYIGSCITSSRVLSSNKEEMDTYFPQLIGLSPNDNDYIRRVKQYLNNIQCKVDELGKTFDISFRYHHYSDYKRISDKEDAIEARYKAANRQNLSELKKALNRKIADLNELESTKYKYGVPVNLEDYLMYRHCLLYNDVAKDQALINSDISIRFYFKDDKKEAEKARKLRNEIVKAKQNYVAAIADEELFEAIYVQYCLLSNRPIISSLLEEEIDKQIKLDRFSQEEPVKFNKLFKDENIKLRSNIEKLIAHGVLVRSQYNQQITSTDGSLIGANMIEAIGWFKNPENNSYVNAYLNQLKNI